MVLVISGVVWCRVQATGWQFELFGREAAGSRKGLRDGCTTGSEQQEQQEQQEEEHLRRDREERGPRRGVVVVAWDWGLGTGDTAARERKKQGRFRGVQCCVLCRYCVALCTVYWLHWWIWLVNGRGRGGGRLAGNLRVMAGEAASARAGEVGRWGGAQVSPSRSL